LKANGSVDSNTYLTSASLPTVDQTIIDGSTNAVSGNAVFDGLALKAPLESPTFTGTPTAPTAPAGTNTTQVANALFVNSAIATVDASNVKLTGNQTIAGTKTFSSPVIIPNGVNPNEAVNKGQLDAVSSNTVNIGGTQFITGQKTFSSGGSTTSSLNSEANSGVVSAALFVSKSGGGEALQLVKTGNPRGVSSDLLSMINQGNMGTGAFINMAVSPTFSDVDFIKARISSGTEVFKVDKLGKITATQFSITSLNTAPASATATGTQGEIRVTATHIYVCIATNTWVRSALTTW
jgi:hypothetical protein